MREILFRGKFGNEWKYGYLTIEPRGLAIKEPYVNAASNIWHIDTKTVGQYTGLNDKNGNRIFEGDICDFCDNENYHQNYEICWSENRWTLKEYSCGGVDILDLFFCKRSVVIGNIYDNPEFLYF